MQTTETLPSIRLSQGPEIVCAGLPDYDESSLAAIQQAFRTVKPCQMVQGWLPEVSPGFAPAAVRVGWREHDLLIFAELTDHDIFSNATRNTQRLWELGDVFEIFLRPANQTAYLQVDIAPNNQRVQLRIPSAEALRRAQTANEFAELVHPGNMVRSATWLAPEQQKWFVFAAIPARAFNGREHLNAKERWHFSFSRYDYSHGHLEPVISSTSPHAQANFHRQQEWGTIQFERIPTYVPKVGAFDAR
jgi:hypothetical protein